MMQPFYMDITDGLAFKRVFGQKPVMLGFLNEVFKGRYKFEDLYFSDPLLLLAPWENPKDILMTRCIDSEERHHYIEVLNADTSYFEWKATGQWLREYKAVAEDLAGLDVGEGEKVTISIVVIANYDRGKKHEGMRSDGLMGGGPGMSFGLDVVEPMGSLVVLDTTKAPTSLSECRDDLERLFCLSKLMVESQEEIVDDSLPEWIVRLMKKAAYASLMPDEIFRYMTSEDDHHYRQVELEDARCDRRDEYMEEGKRQSVKCGVKKGKNAAAEDIAKKMVANEIDMKLISYCTGLSPATIKML